MKKLSKIISLGLIMSTTSLQAQTPPVAETQSYSVPSPHGAREDEYYWLRDDTRENPKILQYLNDENAYADALLAPLKPLEDTLYNELIGRIKQDDSALAYRKHGYWYYTRYVEGQNYPIYARRADAPELNPLSIQEANSKGDFTGEQILLDVNKLAEGHDYYNAFIAAISRDGKRMIWGHDTNGRRQYTLQINDLETGETLKDRITNTSGSAVWSGDSLLYIEKDPTTLLGNKVKRHKLGDAVENDELIYAEKDDSFYIGIGKTRDEKYFIIHTESTISSEIFYAPIDNPKALQSLAPRQANHEYSADHHNGEWFIRSNADGAQNFKLMRAPSDATSREQWQTWVEYDPNIYVESFELFDNFTAIEERSEGLTRIRLLDQDGSSHHLNADEDAYIMGISTNSEADTHWLRYSYGTLVTPMITYEYNIQTGERRQLKQQLVPNYQAENYRTKRIWVEARDGTKIPVSLAFHKDYQQNGTAPVLQYGYGSYGASMTPNFRSTIISLLDRGMVYALAHIRGGEEMGRQWYEDGKMFNKKNTFTDFIDVTQHLVDEKYVAKDKVAAMGGSAGGLLMGAVANMAADKYRVIISQVPFVDVVTTMLDPSIPLTTNEYDEWGNPDASAESYAYMLSYSPYDNLSAQDYPAMFVGTGLWDSQVQYWEPAKYVARLRVRNTGKLPIVMRTNMEAGHGGKSGRFQRYREIAEQYAFMLDQLGIEK